MRRLCTGRGAGEKRQGGQVKQCAQCQKNFSAYLDGAVTGVAMHEIAAHLETCSACRDEFAKWRKSQALVSSIGPAKAPSDLALRLRVAISQQAANTTQEKLARGHIRWQNTFRPLLWQITAGFASTVALLGGVALLVGMFASPEPLLARDEPLGMATSPRFLYTSLGPAGTVTDGNNPVVVQAFVNGEGRVYDFKVISGSVDAKTRAQLEYTLLFSVFAPAQVFGQPVRGTVLLSFSSVPVRG
jgi:anti-sigma factor RsiW